jgi:uncharacterized protein YfbU (UPF0304 family)
LVKPGLIFFTDQEWLDAVNAERTKLQIDKISQESFEIIMDRLEKEWFDLVGSSNAFFSNIPELFPDQEHSQTRLRHAIRGLNMCHL